MAIELPNLDNRTWGEISTWLKERIPLYNGQWTDFNFSDPGITLVELLSWIGETLLYRLNLISDQALFNDMQLLAGASGDQISSKITALSKNNLDLNYLAYLKYIATLLNPTTTRDPLQMQRATLAFFQSPYLTLTLADVEALGLESNRLVQVSQPAPGQQKQMPFLVGRAIAAADSDGIALVLAATLVVSYFTPTYVQQMQQQQGTGSLIVQVANIPSSDQSANYSALIRNAVTYLTPRKPVGVQLQVSQPITTAVNLVVELTTLVDADPQLTASLAAIQLTRYLDPLIGGSDGQGWPYNKAPQESALLQLCLNVTGVASAVISELNYYPTMTVGKLATLGLDTQLCAAPQGSFQAPFRGLPRLHFLEVNCLPSSTSDGGSE